MNSSQWNMRSNSARKIDNTINAQRVIIGRLKLQIHMSETPSPHDSVTLPWSQSVGKLRLMQLNSLGGTTNATFGLTFLRKSPSAASGKTIVTGDALPVSYHGAMVNGSL